MKIGFVSDIHEDIKALRMALAALKKRGCRKIVCLGDSVGYSVPYYGYLWSRDAAAVLETLRKECDVVVAGNHDLFAARKIPVNKAGFPYPKNWYALDFAQRKSRAKGKIWLYEDNELASLLSAKDTRYLAGLPEFAVADFGGVRIFLSHYAYPDLTGSKAIEHKTCDDVGAHFRFMKRHKCALAISGHDHKEGMMLFSGVSAKDVTFGKTKLDRASPTWLHIPAVARGSFANGVAIFDTETYEIETVPLGSPKHVPPEWRKE